MTPRPGLVADENSFQVLRRSNKKATLEELEELKSRVFARGVLAERARFAQLAAGGFHIGALAREIVVDGATKPGVGDVVGRIGGRRQIAAGELVLALGAGLDAGELVGDGIFDRLVVADLEMQERVVLDRAPVRPNRVPAPTKLMAPAMNRPARLAMISTVWSAMVSPSFEKNARVR